MQTIEYKYPLRMRSTVSGRVVDFVTRTRAILVSNPSFFSMDVEVVGKTYSYRNHNDKIWEPVEQPKVSLKEIYANY